MPGPYYCDICRREIKTDFVFGDGMRRCPVHAAEYFHHALDRMEDKATQPTDESRAQSSTGEESCPICDGSGENDNGDACGSCGGTGVRRRPARVDTKPTIAPGTIRRCPRGESVFGPFPASCYIDDECGKCDDPACKWSAVNIGKQRP